MAIDKCVCFKNFQKRQVKELKQELKDIKWFLSEAEGSDVGMLYAQKIFLEQHFKPWAEGFRKKYCEKVCVEAGECELYDDYLERLEKNKNL